MLSLYSIGHGTRTCEDFVQLLQRYGIQYLIDVRTIPYSGFQPQYNRERLSACLHQHGIRYVYMGDCLGGRPIDPSCYSEGKIDYTLLQAKDYYTAGIARLRTAYERQIPAAIMCSESKPSMCHRSRLIGNTLHTTHGISLQHIDEHGQLKSHDMLIKEMNKNKNKKYDINLFGSKTQP